MSPSLSPSKIICPNPYRQSVSTSIEINGKLRHNLSVIQAVGEDMMTRRNDPCPCGSGKKYKKVLSGEG
ncbi:MAG: SEC-C domain-containing protein [Chloroflexi bacterium]|nr:SEC-C domain-containing protein [Chloroflexota bacterium]